MEPSFKSCKEEFGTRVISWWHHVFHLILKGIRYSRQLCRYVMAHAFKPSSNVFYRWRGPQSQFWKKYTLSWRRSLFSFYIENSISHEHWRVAKIRCQLVSSAAKESKRIESLNIFSKFQSYWTAWVSSLGLLFKRLVGTWGKTQCSVLLPLRAASL